MNTNEPERLTPQPKLQEFGQPRITPMSRICGTQIWNLCGQRSCSSGEKICPRITRVDANGQEVNISFFRVNSGHSRAANFLFRDYGFELCFVIRHLGFVISLTNAGFCELMGSGIPKIPNHFRVPLHHVCMFLFRAITIQTQNGDRRSDYLQPSSAGANQGGRAQFETARECHFRCRERQESESRILYDGRSRAI
jgi:hypothetical protein